MILAQFTPKVLGLALTLAAASLGACPRHQASLPGDASAPPGAPAVGGGPIHRGPGAVGAAPVVVRERLVRTVSNGCRYVATVTGTLRESRAAPSDPGAARAYAPQLIVDAEVDCGHGVLHHVAPTTIDGPRYTQAELEQALAEAGRVNVDTAGQICVYRPNIRVERATVVVRSVHETCRRDTPPAE